MEDNLRARRPGPFPRKGNLLTLRILSVAVATTALVLAVLLLPPVSLVGRFLDSSGSSQGVTSTPSTFAVERVTKGPKDVPSLPPGFAALSSLYRLRTESEIKTPTRVTFPLAVTVGPSVGLDVYSYDEGAWRWVASANVTADGKAAEAEITEFPLTVAVVRFNPSPPLISGYLPSGKRMARDGEKHLAMVGLGPYNINEDGSLDARDIASAPSGWPVISTEKGGNYDAKAVNGVLVSERARKGLISSIMVLAQKKDSKGVELDLGGVDPKLTDNLTAFVQDLAGALHGSGRSLSIRLPLPERAKDGWHTGAYNWRNLGRVVDVLKVTTEADQSIYFSRMTEVLGYAVSQVEKRKLLLEIDTSSHQKSQRGVKAISLPEALSLASRIAVSKAADIRPGMTLNLYGAQLLGDAGASGLYWDDNSKVTAFSFPSEDGPQTVWVENALSVAYKIDLARRFRLGGIALKDVSEDVAQSGIWSIVSAYAEDGEVPLVRPNPHMFTPNWQSTGGSLNENGKGWVNWALPQASGEYTISLTVGDGQNMGSSALSVNLGTQPTQTRTPTPAATATPATAAPTPQPSPPVTAPPTPTPKPAAAPPPSGAKYPGVGYGMQVNPGNDLGRALRMLRAAGFGWAKVQIRWEDLEPTKGNIQWNTIDDVVNTGTSHGVKLLFSVVTAPRWARPADTDFSVPGPPADPKDFANFVGAIAERHKSNVQAYEIWNEQNLAREWGGNGRQNAGQYVALLKAAYSTIKAADPDAVVLSGALTPAGNVNLGQGLLARDDREFLREMYAAGLKNYADAVGAHPSGFNNPPDDDPGRKTADNNSFKGHWSFYYRNFETYHQIMSEFGDGGKQIWFTEFGWASSPKPYPEYAYGADNTEEEQAAYLVRAFEIARERGYVGVMAIWNLSYAPGTNETDSQGMRAFGIIRPDWSPRPAYNALAAMPK